MGKPPFGDDWGSGREPREPKEEPKYPATKRTIDLADIKVLLAMAANQVEVKIEDGTELTKQDVDKIGRILEIWAQLESIEDKFKEVKAAEERQRTAAEQVEIDKLTALLPKS